VRRFALGVATDDDVVVVAALPTILNDSLTCFSFFISCITEGLTVSISPDEDFDGVIRAVVYNV
jgi:hypothetical protein